MAKAFALKRTTAQPVTIDTVTLSESDLGSPIAGMQTTPILPARCVNLHTVFGGDPYLLTVSATGNIEIHQYDGTDWNLVGGPFSPAVGHTLTPLCMHTVNDTVVALWTDEGPSNDGIASSISLDGTTWSTPSTELAAIGSSRGGHSIVFKGGIWFATSVGLWCYAPLARFITLSGISGTFLPDEPIVSGTSNTSATVQSFNSPLIRVVGVVGPGFQIGETITGGNSGATATVDSITRFVNAAPDAGNDTNLGSASVNVLGCFARWDGVLYFVQPKTAVSPLRFYQLATDWEAANNVPAPQWTNLTFSGVVDAGFAVVGDDSGMWCLFVNRNDELCLFYSGSGSTKLAKTTSKTLPLMFTDLTNSLLPSEVATRVGAGVTLYTDDRRRDNVLQNFLIRDLVGGTTDLTSWDGTSAVELKGSIPDVDYILPASQRGQQSTFTNLQPAVKITLVTQPFPGRLRIDYVVRSDPERLVDIIAEYSIAGDVWSPMTQGDDDSGIEGLTATPIGIPYFFNWDAFADLDGDFNNMEIRIVPRISGV